MIKNSNGLVILGQDLSNIQPLDMVGSGGG